MGANAKNAGELGNAPNAATGKSRLVKPRRERRAAWLATPKKERMPWRYFSLGRPTHRLDPEPARPYVPKKPTDVGDFESIALAEIKRSIKNRRWAYGRSR